MTRCPRELALAHLLLRLRPLLRAMRGAIALRDANAQKLRASGAVVTAISRGHVDALLDQLGELIEHRSISTGDAVLTAEEQSAEQQLRDKAVARGARLPFDVIADQLRLDAFECEVLALCASVELDIEYERIVAYLHDDVARRAISVELAAALTAGSLRERIARRAALTRMAGCVATAWSPRHRVTRVSAKSSGSCLRASTRCSASEEALQQDCRRPRQRQPLALVWLRNVRGPPARE